MKKLVIFDLDGTLLNTIADLGGATNHALAEHGFPIHPVTSYPMMVGNGVRRLIERALPAENRDAATVDTLLATFREYYDSHLSVHTRPYDGIESLLAGLTERGVAVAVASNKYESATQRLIKEYFPDIPFVAVCGQTENVPVKPDPSIVFRILSIHPTPKSEVLYVGDSAVDIETARRACVDSAGVSWGFRPVRELTGAYADTIVSSPADILTLATGD